MEGGCEMTNLDTLCYVSTLAESRMNEDNHEDGSSIETQNPSLRKEEPEKSDVENPEEDVHNKWVIQGGENEKSSLDLLFDAIDIIDEEGEGEEEQGEVASVGSRQSSVLLKNKDQVYKDEEEKTTTVEAPCDGAAVDSVAAEAEAVEGNEEHGNGGGGGGAAAADGDKDGSFTEKENTQLENGGNEDTKAEDSEEDESGEENGVADPDEKTPSLDEGFYEVEAIRHKKYSKGRVLYFVKWLGWEESQNTWEPKENLVGVPDVIEAFEEGLKSVKQPKRKRKEVVQSAPLKTRVERSVTRYSLRCLKTNTGNKNNSQAAKNNSQSAPVNERPITPAIPDIPAFPQTVLFADEVEDDGEGSGFKRTDYADGNRSENLPEEVPLNNKEKEYDPKLSELKAATTNGNAADNLALPFQEAMVSPGNTKMNDLPNVVCTEPITENTVVGTEQVQNVPSRPANRRRKSSSVKRFKIDPCANKLGNTQIQNSAPVGKAEPAQTGVTDNAAPSSHATMEPVKPACDIVKILKPVDYTATLTGPMQDVLVTFEVLRSDGSEVKVDNKHLKTYHPILLIDYYEQHLRYTPKPL